MTKAPERLKVSNSITLGVTYEKTPELKEFFPLTEYTRTDNALALVAAAYEDAASVCTGDTERPEPIPAKKLRRMSVQDQFAHEQERLAWMDADEIRARTPDDATAALERVKQEAFQEGYEQAKADETAAIIAARREIAEQAAKLADEWYHNSGHGSPGDEIRAALITEGQSDG